MMMMKTSKQERKKAARDFARKVIETNFGQQIKEDELDEVVQKILKTIPDRSDSEIRSLIRFAVEQERKRCADVVRDMQEAEMPGERAWTLLDHVVEAIEKGE